MLSFGEIGGISGSSGITSTSPPKKEAPSEARKLCLKLRSTFTPEDWTKFESSLTPVRLGFFVQNEEVKLLAQSMLSRFPSCKDKGKALTLKNEGNKVFGSGDNEGALRIYTKCLAWMPHGNGDHGCSSDAAIVYANRSAALYHLAKYELSERDCHLALELGYPPELNYKVYERLARCSLDQGIGEEAANRAEKAINSIKLSGGGGGSKLDESKREKIRSGLESLLKSCKAKGNTSGNEKGNISFAGITKGLPEVVGGRSEYLPSCSRGLVLRSNEKKGRFLVANEAFHPGDVILVEKASVSVLLPQHYHLQCFQCYKALEAPIMCGSCIYVSYCSSECRDKSWRTHHQYECSILGALKHSGISVICYMALRLVTQTSPREILDWYELIAPRNENARKNMGDGSSTPYKSDHTSLFNLVTHSERRSAESDFHMCMMTSYLLNMLSHTDYIKKAMDHKGIPAGEAQMKLGLILHRCLQFLQFNTHETSAWDPDLTKDNSVGLGGGLFPTLALFNHSCNPALVRYFINDTVVVRAIRTIRPGEEVTENYGQCFITSGKSERQLVLRDQFWFECDCLPCLEDWPTFDKLSSMDGVKFRCEHCGTYICRVDENMGLLYKCGRCGQPVNILKNLKCLQDSEEKFKKAMQFLDGGDEEKALGILLENIQLLDKHLMAPLKDLHVCQEHVRKCLLNCGNRVSKVERWEPENVQ